MKNIGPIKISGPVVQGEIRVPLATFETPLWPSTGRGALVSRLTTGIHVEVIDDRMTRSILVEGPNVSYVLKVASELQHHKPALINTVIQSSRYAQLKDWHIQIIGKLLYLRFELSTGDASGHNMVTKAADTLLEWLLQQYSELSYVSISGNYCTDKKVSAVNGILGRGKNVVAEMVIPQKICHQYLKSTPEKIVNLHIKKNLIGSILAGSIRSANAHFANMLLGIYLATGQDAANIIEGSQGIVHAELKDKDLYFSVTLPNIIVGTIGNGKELPFVRQNLELLGCLSESNLTFNSRRLAAIVGATVLCGELSLLAAQTNPGELMQSHLRLERVKTDKL